MREGSGKTFARISSRSFVWTKPGTKVDENNGWCVMRGGQNRTLLKLSTVVVLDTSGYYTARVFGVQNRKKKEEGVSEVQYSTERAMRTAESKNKYGRFPMV